MRFAALLLVLPLLAGCSDADWNHLMNFGGGDQDQADGTYPTGAAPTQPTQMAATAAPAQAAAAPNPFCMSVATRDATTNGFDTATQGRVAQRSYQQCVALFGDQQR